MGIEETLIRRREKALAEGKVVVPDNYQGVSKQRVREVLALIDQSDDTKVDVVFSLLCDEPSWYPKVSKLNFHFYDGASVAHIGSHVGILQRGRNNKLDREGRDMWLKPLWEIGAVEKVLFFDNEFMAGHPVPKSSYSAYRLSSGFKDLLQADDRELEELARTWIDEDVTRERLAFQAAQAQETANKILTPHSRLISLSAEIYAKRFLQGYEVIFIDDGDGDRITDEQREALQKEGLSLDLGDSMPDVLLINRETNHLWVIEAVTSDGEVDIHKKRSLEEFAKRNGKSGVGFTTSYLTWKKAAERQTKMKNLADGTYLWIHDDPSRNILINQS